MKRIIMVWVILVIALVTPILGQPDGSMTGNIPAMSTWTDTAVITTTTADFNIYGGATKTTDFFIVEYEGYDWNPCPGDT